MAEIAPPPTGFRPHRGEPPSPLEVIILNPQGEPFIGPRESVGMKAASPPIAVGAPPEASKEPLIDLGKMVRQGALPTIGGAIGAAAGTIAAPGFGTVAGGALGSGLGEAANQFLGITEPSKLQMGLAASFPLLPAAIRAGVANVPGAEAGRQALALKIARTLGKKVGPTEDPGALYEAARASGTTVPKGPMGASFGEVAAREALVAPGIRLSSVHRSLKAVEQMLALPEKEIPLAQFQSNLSRLGAIYRAVSKKGGPAQAELAELYGGLQASLDKAAKSATGQGATILRQANEQWKRHLAESEIKGLVQRAVTSKAGHPGFNADSVLEHLDEGSKTWERLSTWVDSKELLEIKDILQRLAKIAPVPSTGQSGFQGISLPTRAIVGGALGLSMGGPLGAAGGILATEGLTRVLMSPPGRAVVKALSSPKIGGGGMGFDQIMNLALQATRVSKLREPEPSKRPDLPPFLTSGPNRFQGLLK